MISNNTNNRSLDLSDTESTLAERRDAAYKDLPWTAFFVSWTKAIEDPIQKIFFKDNDVQDEMDRACGGYPLLWPLHRVHFFDRIARQSVNGEICVGKPTNQIVTLGSGLDTRSVRMAEVEASDGSRSRPRYYEIDREAIVEYKKMCYDLEGYNYENNAMVSGDYIAEFDQVFRILEERGLRRNEPVTIIWEGNLGYLDSSDVLRTILRICRFFENTTVYFAIDVIPTAWCNERRGEFLQEELGMLHILEELLRLGIPMFNGYDDIETEIITPINDMLSVEGVKGTLVLVSNESCTKYANPQLYPNTSKDTDHYRMIHFRYQC
eukprot:Clim_evm4s179 gene=Clim_evmTU4s179